MSEIQNRLKQYLNVKGWTARDFERRTGLGNGTCSSINNNTRKTTFDRISNSGVDLNISWLLTGKGEMLRDNTPADYVPKTYPTGIHPTGHKIKYFPDVDGYMGGVTFLDTADSTSQDIIIPGYSDCQFAINAYGDSMSPLIKSGQVVLLSQWTENFFEWGKIYLVITKSGYRTIKRLYPTEGNPQTITCRSENKETNPPFEIQKEDITRCFIVKGWICRDMI